MEEYQQLEQSYQHHALQLALCYYACLLQKQ